MTSKVLRAKGENWDKERVLRVNEGRRQKAGGTVFVTGIYTPLQKSFALKGEVLGPIVLIKRKTLPEIAKVVGREDAEELPSR